MPDANASQITPLEGKTAIDDKMFFEPERLSYDSADRIAEKIASEIGTAVRAQVVVIAGTTLLGDFANLQAVYLTLESLKRDYDAVAAHAGTLAQRRSLVSPGLDSFVASAAAGLVSGAVSGVISPAATAVSAALGLVSLFREDVEYRGVKTAVDPLAFELALASKVKAGGAGQVFVPDLMVIPLAEAGKGSLQARLEELQKAKARAWAVAGPLITELVRLDGELDRAAKDKNQERLDRLATEVSDMRRDMQPVSDPLGRCDQRLADLQNQWNQANESGLTLLARLLRAEAIHAMNPLYLHAEVVSSGGHHRISRSLFRTVFLGDGLSFAGGATARWALLQKDGSVAQGGILVVKRRSDARG
jgi:hypothetical protein